uniref:Gypsy retrotransposon integrase-like protein 1 n=1 Tax=Cyprinus carpio carpio TaxID=630221 RepID=A0A9J8B112_CYPCA
MGCLSLPLHDLYLMSDLVTGPVTLGVCSHLPVDGVDVILGNDLAGGDVFPRPLVITEPAQNNSLSLVQKFPAAFPACVVTRAQRKKMGDVIDLSESFLVDSDDRNLTPEKAGITKTCEVDYVPELKTVLGVGREPLAAAQRTDPSLASCIESIVNLKRKPHDKVKYFWEGEVLMRRWRPIARSSLNTVHQIVLPQPYREPVLKIAHEHVLSGHLGVTKTYKRVSRYFFWPGLKSAVSKFCRSCAACQIAGKPNQKLPVAPLRPIPVMREPFERLLLDCVGPLPKSKSGHEYILSIMCTSTRFPEAIPLRSTKAHIIVRELIKFCTVFGLPKVIQTDQGTNFTSKLFSQTLTQFGIKHKLSSAFHPQSQGAVERFHQTLKTMLRTYCFSSGKDWAESLPFLMFAIREAEQESLGFSPADLVFGHTVRGPLKVLSEQLLAKDAMPVTVLDYVSSFRERLHRAWDLAREHLTATQSKMKAWYDKKSVSRSFQPNDEVLVLLPAPGSSLHAKFTGPYSVKEKLSDTDYVVSTPDRQRKTRVCHINMLKRFVRDSKPDPPCNLVTTPLPVAVAEAVEQDGKGLLNSAVLKDLPSFLSHLEPEEASQTMQLMHRYSPLFSDVPGRTTVLEHDIDVGFAKPIKQHSYRVNPTKRHIMKTEVEYMLQHGLAQHSQSPWSSPCLLVPKADGTYRFCTDFRKVNAVTKPDSFPLPRMEDCVDRVGSARFVTKLDLLKGYWQVPLTTRAAEISAFATPDHFLEYSVLAFGMRNAPATFQRLMKIVLGDVPNCDA